MTDRASRRVLFLLGALVVAALVGCDGSDAGQSAGEAASGTSEAAALRERIDAIGQAVGVWRTTNSFEDARASAETAANLIVGPGGPGYGDRDGNGTVAGDTDFGLLPALDGAGGLASALEGSACVVNDVLGGAWDDPAGRWATMLTAIEDWRPTANTMPSLPSHPMRVVGWATFTLASDSLDEAHEYAGHAALHVDISRAALDC